MRRGAGAVGIVLWCGAAALVVGVPVALSTESPAAFLLGPLLLSPAAVAGGAHALAARACRTRLISTGVGCGPLVGAYGRRTRVEVRLVPFGTAVRLLSQHVAGASRRTHVVLQAGPVANVLTAVAALAWSPWPLVVALPHLVNAVLVPRGLGPVGDDLSEVSVAVERALTGICGRLRTREAVAAVDQAEALLGEAGVRSTFGEWMANLLVTRGRYREAIELARKNAADPDQRPNALASLAWAELLLGDPARWPDALSAAQEADAALSAVATRHTVAALLVALGRADEAVPLLDGMYARVAGHPANAACVAATCAAAAAAVGRPHEARRWLRRAERDDPYAPLVDAAERAVSAAV